MSGTQNILRVEPRNGPKPGIVHLGLGAFFRAHGAIYVKEAVEKSGGDWGVVGVSLRSDRVRDILSARRGLYTAVETSEAGYTPQDIDVISDVLVAPESANAVVKEMADKQIKIVSLTITEKGYCRGAGGQGLDLEHTDIKHDISNTAPKSAIGFIVRALDIRRTQNLRPFTVLCLDNLPGNGQLVRRLTLELAGQINADLALWIEKECCFPSTMVDRIVPASTPEMIERLLAQNGEHDPGAVFHEPFRQFVIEDSFVDDLRPDFGAVGVQLVEDVEPFEKMKLRMLNGSHSALAYIGHLAGHETVNQAVSDSALSEFLAGLWKQELATSLEAPPETDLDAYASQLRKRFANTEIRHLLKQIAMDGSQKLQQRILDPLFENLAAGRPYRRLLFVVAAWFRFLQLQTEIGTIDDPLSDALMHAVNASNDTRALVDNLTANKSVFGSYPVEKITDALVDLVATLEDGDVFAALDVADF